jgi:pimeloyl-ACP methyl ester carboxylesterase
MAFAQLSTVRLEYFPHGEGPERVVFIHGFQASAKIWRMVQQALPADRYASIAINNRGAGNSEAPPHEADFGVQPFAADAVELVGQLGWRDFTLVGHSMGGATVAQFAVDHPDLLKGLILLDPADPDGRSLPAGVTMDALLDGRMAARREQLARGGAGDGIDASGAGANAALMRDLLGGAPGALRDIVLVNSAAALVVAGRAEDLRAGMAIAARAIDSGAARQVLERLVAMTNEGNANG